ncbi:hypothetical protein Nepgr_005041 [Nepenthes gracilis]|uniref:DUF4378 domain-containing protein n=1 Tax=Nepenthes gracilis TaxID=150966 RepID=A0AAD3S2G1_NEPGR|nr:hypothetical protein Nepgr_005041 [Nepenthes gracilis]
MASTPTTKAAKKQGSPKRLGEFIKEQQEPFVLEVYLLERRNSRKSSNGSSSKLLKRSVRKCGVENRRKGTNFVRALCEKLASINEILGFKSSYIKDGKNVGDFNEEGRRTKEAEESGGDTSASCTAVSNTGSETEIETEEVSINTNQNPRQFNTEENESATDRMLKWRFAEESKQCSPVSVLDHVEALPVYNERQDAMLKHDVPPSTASLSLASTVTKGSIFSGSLWELLAHSRSEKPGCPSIEGLRGFIGSSPCSQPKTSRKVLTRQLLFDCVREVVESHERKQRRTQKAQPLIVLEEVKRIMCENVKAWANQSADKTGITRLLQSDVLGSTEKLSDFEVTRRETMTEIGDGIFEEIKDEVVKELVHHFCTAIFTSCRRVAAYNPN